MYDAIKAHEAQEKWCEEHKAPHFAPGGYRQFKCYRCNQNIYSEKGYRIASRSSRGVIFDRESSRDGITVECAGKELITGCPFCNTSYCD